jgi:hypothetical protein
MTESQHTAEEITRALATLVECHGNSNEAAKQTGIPAGTLRRWRTSSHSAEYERLEAAHGKEIEDELVARWRENARRAGEVEAKLIERTESAMMTMSSKDASAAARNMADVKSKSIDKVLALTGREPTAKPIEDFMVLVEHMQARGFITVKGLPAIDGHVSGEGS